MRKLLKRFVAAASAVVIGGVSCVTSWFSVPVSAIGVFSPFNFYQLYQMLHGLLLGDGGGNSQTFGEWLEKNMTRTVGSGNSKQEFLITPDMKLSDMMDEASMRLMLGAACSDGGFAGVSKMKDLIDSWTEVYDTSDIGEIGSGALSSGFGQLSDDGFCYRVTYPSSGGHISSSTHSIWFQAPSSAFSGTIVINFFVDHNGVLYAFLDAASAKVYLSSSNLGIIYSWSSTEPSGYLFQSITPDKYGFQHFFLRGTWDSDICAPYISVIRSNGYNLLQSDCTYSEYISKFSDVVFSGSNSDDFIGPVYAMPAAKQLITDTGTLSGLRLDVQTEDGTPDISAALDHAGVESVDDLVAGVAAGTIPMSQVYEDMRVVPYVLTDVETGQVVTDLNVSATDAKTKAVALDKTLSIPKDVSAVDAYQVTGKTWDPSLSKYKLPLFNFFPFCLPWDIYQVLSAFAADPVAPSITVPVGKFFSGKKSFDGSAAADITATIDLGDDKFSKWFVMLRALESAGIVIGLVLVSVKLIHGGR